MHPLIKANEIKLVLVTELKYHPKNPNKHSDYQIERLKKIIKYQGFRRPVTVSNQSGFITVGHGRVQAAKALGMEYVPVIYQDYDDATQEYADVVADNASAALAELDFGEINLELPELGPDFDLEMLGLQDFALDPSEKPSSQQYKSNMEKLEGYLDSSIRRITFIVDEQEYHSINEFFSTKQKEHNIEDWTQILLGLINNEKN